MAEPSAATVLLVLRAQGVHELRDSAGTLLERWNKWAVLDVDQSPKQRLVSSLRWKGYATAAVQEGAPPVVDVRTLQQWSPVSRSSARTRGEGRPNAEWIVRPGELQNVAGHESDYCYFNTPLTGDFDVECDISVSAWQLTTVSVGGMWIGPTYKLNGFDTGYFRYNRPRVEFTPELLRTRHWMHLRTTVRDGMQTTTLNGRKVLAQPVEQNADPWVAVHNMARNSGIVRNLRITGSPEIPESIDLLADVAMKRWSSYFDESIGDVRDDWVIINGELTGRHHQEGLAGVDGDNSKDVTGWNESLLRYHRPMLEDGVIAYEFFYSPGEVVTYPAIDRLAFVLTAEGVQLHQVTDGRFDRTGMPTDNLFAEPAHCRGPALLPLKADDWNKMEVDLRGDVVTLRINAQDVFQRTLEPSNQRTFGLFHFADRTSLRVRNMTWRGDWPRELLPVAEQELASQDTQFLYENTEHLAAAFIHDFTSDGLPENDFTIIRGSQVDCSANGLHVHRDGTGGYLNATVASSLQIHGDFDVIAEFDEFSSSAVNGGSATIALMVVLENSSNDEHWIGRRHYPRPNDTVEEVAQCVVVRRLPDGDRRSYFSTLPMEERGGRFRLSRRGEKLYYMTAEGDSPNWQLRGDAAITRDPVATDGLRLFSQIHEPGFVDVVWKRIEIHAERLNGLAIDGTRADIAELNQQRDLLAK
ncbi:MAG: DUF1583 domain-containing protein, partial [Planctomycetaceae bacterium]|nr:DUF1583 domain-containing protein [Planctomycetaceae bacterium]